MKFWLVNSEQKNVSRQKQKKSPKESDPLLHTFWRVPICREWHGLESNQRPPGYEPSELPLLYRAARIAA